jgi:hypothetical protein
MHDLSLGKESEQALTAQNLRDSFATYSNCKLYFRVSWQDPCLSV